MTPAEQKKNLKDNLRRLHALNGVTVDEKWLESVACEMMDAFKDEAGCQ